jgi:hypothetical protein
MVSVSQGNHCVCFSIGFGKIIGEIVGLAAGVEEEDRIQTVAKFCA